MRSSGAVSRLLAADRPYRLVVAQISAGALTAEAAEAQQHRDEDEQASARAATGKMARDYGFNNVRIVTNNDAAVVVEFTR